MIKEDNIYISISDLFIINNCKKQFLIRNTKSEIIVSDSSRKGAYFIPILIFIIPLFVVMVNIAYRFHPGYIFYPWESTSNTSLFLLKTWHIFFFGGLSWAIVNYYFGTINSKRFKRGIKAISLFYPFWLSICAFISSVGVSTYHNIWFIAHLSLWFWAIGGFLFAFIMVLNFILFRLDIPIMKNRLTREKLEIEKEIIPRSRFTKAVDFLEKHEFLTLLCLLLILGSFFGISNFFSPEGTPLLAFVFIFFTLFIANLLFIVNYLLSINQNYHIEIKKKEEQFYLEDFEKTLKNLNKLIEEGNIYFSKEEFEVAIEKWEGAIELFNITLKVVKEKKKTRENKRVIKLNLLDAYKGAAMNHLNKGQEAYKNLELKNTQNEWKISIERLQTIIELSKFKRSKLDRKEIKSKIEDIQNNLKRLEIEIMISNADEELKSAHLLQDEEITKTIKLTNEIVLMYSNVKKRAEKSKKYNDYAEKIQNRLLNVRAFQKKLQEKLDKLIGVTPLEKRVKFEMDELTEFEIATVIKDEIIKQIISVIREYEFIGGQIRFKIGLVNNSNYPLTNFRITFDLPKSLKWILHEPNYERKGDSILIAKIGAKEKKAVSLYLEPLNCMESHINATVSFFDAKDRPHAIPMKPKMVNISCPIFFTESDANLARVKSLRRNLTHRDKKIFPIINPAQAASIFSSMLSVLEQFDIKMISKEFFEDENFGEAWFFGITKIKKESLVMYVLLDGNRKTLKFEVSGNNEEQITAFLAEIGDRIRQKLIENNIIASEEGFYDMRITILSCLCPYCYTLISSESVEKFCNGEVIICENCAVNIKVE